MSMRYTEHPEEGWFEITVSGRVSREDFDAVAPRIERLLEKHDSLSMVEVLKEFDWFDADVLLPGMKFDLAHIRRFDRVAVVTESGWIGPLARVVGAVTPIRIRLFPPDDIEAARRWAAEGD